MERGHTASRGTGAVSELRSEAHPSDSVRGAANSGTACLLA